MLVVCAFLMFFCSASVLICVFFRAVNLRTKTAWQQKGVVLFVLVFVLAAIDSKVQKADSSPANSDVLVLVFVLVFSNLCVCLLSCFFLLNVFLICVSVLFCFSGALFGARICARIFKFVLFVAFLMLFCST